MGQSVGLDVSEKRNLLPVTGFLNFAIEQAMKFQRWSRGIALLFF
jgi:hypothetical protein